MKRIFLFVAVAAAALSLGGCQRGGGGNAEPMNFKKLTNGKAVYRGEEAGLRHYAVTLWTNGHSTAAVDNYKDADISLALELVTAASGAEAQIASGEDLFSADAQAGVILASAQSTLSVFTEYSYGGDRQALSGGSVTVSFYNGKYEIKGSVTDVWDRVLEFTYYGEIAFEGTGPVEPETTTVTFEAAELSAATGTYSDILWGREQAAEVDGSQVYNGFIRKGPLLSGAIMPMTERGSRGAVSPFRPTATWKTSAWIIPISSAFMHRITPSSPSAMRSATGAGSTAFRSSSSPNRYGWFPPRWPMRTRPITIVWRIRA